LNQQVKIKFKAMKIIKDNTALIPFVLFAIFAGIVFYAIRKGTKTVGITASNTDTDIPNSKKDK